MPVYIVRWKPHAPTEASALLSTVYYWVQIQIHRPFLRAQSEYASNIAVCVTAARSCTHIIHIHDRTFGTMPMTTMMATILHSALVLLINARNGHASPRDVKDVQLSMDALAHQEERFQAAGRYQYVLITYST